MIALIIILAQAPDHTMFNILRENSHTQWMREFQDRMESHQMDRYQRQLDERLEDIERRLDERKDDDDQ